MFTPALAVNFQRVADVESCSDLVWVKLGKDFDQFSEIAAKVSMSGGRMILDDGADADFFVHGRQVFEFGAKVGDLPFEGLLGMAIHEACPIELDTNFFGGAQYLLGVRGRGDQNRCGQQGDPEALLPE